MNETPDVFDLSLMIVDREVRTSSQSLLFQLNKILGVLAQKEFKSEDIQEELRQFYEELENITKSLPELRNIETPFSEQMRTVQKKQKELSTLR